MRSYEEISAELSVATATDHVADLERLALEMDAFDFPKAVAARCLARGRMQYLRGDLHEALRHIDQALSSYEQINERLGMALTHQAKGMVYKRMGDIAEATIAQRRALAIFEDIGDMIGVAESMSELGKVFMVIDDYPQVNPIEACIC